MSDGKIIYDVEVNDEGVEGKVRDTNEKVKSAADTGSSAFSEVWTGALRAVGGKLVELGQQAVSSAVDVAKESLAQVASFEQNVGGIEKLFGDSTTTAYKTVMENADQAFRTAGISANEYMENVTGFSASLINSLGGDTEEAAKLADVAIRGMSDNANTFGTNMESITTTYQGFAKGNYTMLDNLKLGYGGTKEEMQRLIQDASKLTDVQAQLGLTVDSTSMDFANIIKAIEVMQTQMNIAGTTTREASGTIEGSVNSLKAAWDNFLTGTMDGESLAEIAYDAVNNIVEAFKTIIPRLAEGLGTFIPMMAEFAFEVVGELAKDIGAQVPALVEKGTEMIRGIGEGLVQGIPEFLGKALPMVEDFTANLRANVGKFVDAGIDFILNLMQGLMNSLPTLVAYVPTIISNVVNIINDNMPKILAMGVKLIGMLIEGIVKTVPALIENFPKIIQMIFDIWQAIDWLNIGKFVINGIKNGVTALATAIPNLMKNIGENAKNFIRNIDWRTLGTNIINFIVNGIRSLISAIPNLMRSIGENGRNLIRNIDWRSVGSTIINFITNGITSLISSIPNLLRSIGSTAMSAFRAIDWLSLGSAVISGIANGLWNGVGRIVDAAQEVASRALSAAKSFLGIHSPSKAFMEVGEQSTEGQAIGMIESADLVEDASKEVAQRALDAQMSINYTLPDIDSASRDMSANLSSSFMSTVQRIIEVPLNIDAREIARATAWDMGEQLAWEMR